MTKEQINYLLALATLFIVWLYFNTFYVNAKRNYGGTPLAGLKTVAAKAPVTPAFPKIPEPPKIADVLKTVSKPSQPVAVPAPSMPAMPAESKTQN